MSLKFYNTLGRKKELFKSLKDKYVRFYTCGPTLYGYPHIGNYRAYIFEDILRRYLKFKGFKVKQVMNLTDVDDKTIKGSRKQGISLKEFTKKYADAFFEDLKTLNIDPAEVYPRATEHVNEMVEIIQQLLKNGIAYKADDGSIYYDISKFKDYGKLSKIKLGELKAGARVSQDEYEKENAHDFALWKAWNKEDGDVFWETPLGKGRPGWHIECSAMSTKYLGKSFDIHTGGVDNMFPHHENEIAQSEGANNMPFVKYWLHCEHLNVDGKKMSKSLGNFYTLRDILKKNYKPRAIRYLLLSTHYRQKLNFTLEGLDSANNAVERLLELKRNLNAVKEEKGEEVKELISKTKKRFEEAMDDDLNISEALAVIFDFVKEVNTLLANEKLGKKEANEVLKALKDFDSVLGVLEEEKVILEDEILKLIEEREKARKQKDFEKADEIRNKLKEQGILLDDTKDGVRWKKV